MNGAGNCINPSPTREEEIPSFRLSQPNSSPKNPRTSQRLKCMLAELVLQAKLECNSNYSVSKEDNEGIEEEEGDQNLGGLTEETIERLCKSEYANDVLRICQKMNGSSLNTNGGRESIGSPLENFKGTGSTIFSDIDDRQDLSNSTLTITTKGGSGLPMKRSTSERVSNIETFLTEDRGRSSSEGVTKSFPSDPSSSRRSSTSSSCLSSLCPKPEEFSVSRMTSAIEEGNIDRVIHLLGQYRRLPTPSTTNNSPDRRPIPNFFHYALTLRQEGVALSLLQHEGSSSPMIDAKDPQGRTSLMLAVIYNLLRVVKALMLPPSTLATASSSPSSSNLSSSSASAPRSSLCLLSRTRQRRRSLTPLDLRAVSIQGHRATCYAALNGHIDILEFLLTHMSGGDSSSNFVNCIQSQSAPCGHALLHHAVQGNHYRTIKWLVQKGANVNVPTKGSAFEDGHKKWTPLHCAIHAFLEAKKEAAIIREEAGRAGPLGGRDRGPGNRGGGLFSSPPFKTLTPTATLSPAGHLLQSPSLRASFSFSSPASPSSFSSPARTPSQRRENDREESEDKEKKALKIIRWLIEEGKADMIVKDAHGRTPYDIFIGSTLYQRENSGSYNSNEMSPGRPGRGRDGGREVTSMKRVGKYLVLMQKKQRAVDAAMGELFDGENWDIG